MLCSASRTGTMVGILDRWAEVSPVQILFCTLYIVASCGIITNSIIIIVLYEPNSDKINRASVSSLLIRLKFFDISSH